jgi:hypothetical protein
VKSASHCLIVIEPGGYLCTSLKQLRV